MQLYRHHRPTSRRNKTTPEFIGVQHSPNVKTSQGYNLAIHDGTMEYTDKTSLIPLKENKIELHCIYFIIL
jgi:hypothetical protein